MHEMPLFHSQTFQDKQNSDFVNRLLVDKVSQIQRRNLIQESQESETEYSPQSHMPNKLGLYLKKQKLRTLITEILKSRKQRDRQHSHSQIFAQILVFKMFSSWKKLTTLAIKQSVQAQLFKQRKQFHLFNKCFTKWADLVKKPKQQNFNLKKKWFQELKIACSCELSLRLRRMEVERFFLEKNIKLLILYLSQKVEQGNKKILKARKHFIKSTKANVFKSLKLFMHKDNDQKIRYQEYKLAYLFRIKCLLLRAFKSLKKK